MHPLLAPLVLSPSLKKTLAVLSTLGAISLGINYAIASRVDAPTTGSDRTPTAISNEPSASGSLNPNESTSEATTLTESGLARAKSDAVEFSESFASYNWNESKEQSIKKVARWLAPSLLEQMKNDSGATFLQNERERTHENAVARAEHLQVIGSTATSAEFLLVIVVTTSNDSGKSTERSTINLRLNLIGEQWLISEIG